MIHSPAAVEADGRGRITDFLCAAAAGALALALYLRTLAPGLVAIFDTPMFQFIGRVLGVPHNPGYPLYVVLTWAFSYVPIGTLPYRINLFSAVCGAVTASLVVLLARELGCRRTVAVGAGLGLAFGPVFWSQSVIAEVYTLDSAIVAGMLLSLLTWGRSHRAVWFYGAIALLAAGLGNHTTILGFAPGVAVHALAVDRRFALRPRTLLASAAILALGLLQYGFVLVRSQQPGVYAESHAATLRELAQVMSGAQFQRDLFAFDLRTVLTGQLPMVVTRILVPELTIVGTLLAIVGLAWLLRRRLDASMLLLSGAVAIFVFALNYAVVDLPVFLIPTMLVGWVFAGVGAERVAAAAARHWRPAGAAVGLATLVLAATQVATNFAASDLSRETGDAARLDRLFDALPDRTAIVHEDFLVDRLVAFELYGRRAAVGREIVQIAADDGEIDRFRERGFTVLGFPKAVDLLRRDGLDFGFAPLALKEHGLRDLLQRLPDGAIVALAVPAAYSAGFADAIGDALSIVGVPGELRSRAGSALAIVGTRGAHTGAIARAERRDVHVAVASGQPIGDAGRGASASFEIDVAMESAVIRQGGREIVRTTQGAALACWLPDGQRARQAVLDAKDGFAVPIPAGPLSVYRLLGRLDRRPVSHDGWTDLTSSARTGGVTLAVPAGASLVLYAGDDHALAPYVFDRWPEGALVDIRMAGPDDDLPEELTAARAAGATQQAQLIQRIQVTAPEGEPARIMLALGGVPSHAVGRVIEGSDAGTAAVYRVDTHDLLRRPDLASASLMLANDDQTLLVGGGWSAVDHDAASVYRWMTAAEARLLLPLSGTPPQRIRVQVLRETSAPAASLGLRVNGVALPAQPLETGWHVYEWTLPDGVFRPGTNDLTLVGDEWAADGGSRGHAIAVSDVRLEWDGVE